MHNNNLHVLLTISILVGFLTACSSSATHDTQSIPNKKTTATSGINFSNLSELSYTSAASSYHISPHDLLEIKVFQAEELSQELRVNPNGFISLPLIGKIRATGLTQEQLQSNITAALKKSYLQNPQVTIFIKEYTNQRVTVGGDVRKSGVFPIVGQMSLLQAIAQAEGLDELAKPTEVIIFRKGRANKTKAYLLNLKDIRKGKSKDPYLQNEDKVVVQRSGSRQWLRDIRTNIPFIGATR